MSNALLIAKAGDHPEIIFDKENQKFEITGKSLPEDVNEFYDPVLDWIREYAKNPNKETVITFNLEYYNSASVRKIVDIMTLFESIQKAGNKVKIIWMFEESDEMMGENGEDFDETIDVEFEIISFTAED